MYMGSILVSALMASATASASSAVDVLDGLYLGAGIQYVAYDEYSATPLAFAIRYAPAWASTIRPYARLMVTSEARPTDDFKAWISEVSMNHNQEELDNLSWRLTTLDVRAGIEADLPAELFLRTGLLFEHSDEQGMIDTLVDEASVLMDFSTQTRIGFFAAVGMRFDLDPVLLESSLVLSHYIGRSVGGEGLLEDCDGSGKWDPEISTDKAFLQSDFCTRKRSDLATGQTVIGVDNHLNIGPVALSAALFYGKIRSSKHLTELAEEGGDTSSLNPSFYGAMLTVGYEFGH